MRSLSSPALAVLNGANPAIALLVEMDFTTPIYLNSSRMTLTIGGHDYLGVGPLGQIQAIKETSAELPQLSFALSGVPSSMVALTLAEPVQGKAVTVKMSVFDPSTGAVLDVGMRYSGLVDVMSLADGRDSAAVSVTAESVLLDLLRPSGIYFNDEDQQALHSGDLAFQFVNVQSDQKIVWPSRSFWAK